MITDGADICISSCCFMVKYDYKFKYVGVCFLKKYYTMDVIC